jgi:hypothetical protein
MQKEPDVDPLIEAYVRLILTEDEGGGGGFSVATDYGTGLAQIGGKSIGSVIADPIKNALKVGAGEVRKNAKRVGTMASSIAKTALGEDAIVALIKKFSINPGFWGSLWIKHAKNVESIHSKYKEAYDEVDKHTNGNADAVFTAFVFNPGAVLARAILPKSADLAFDVVDTATDSGFTKLWEKYKSKAEYRVKWDENEERRHMREFFRNQVEEKDSATNRMLKNVTAQDRNKVAAEQKQFLQSLHAQMKAVKDAGSVEELIKAVGTNEFKSMALKMRQDGQENDVLITNLKNIFYHHATTELSGGIKRMQQYGLSKSQEPVTSYVRLYNELTRKGS